jgi:hypothetical protein
MKKASRTISGVGLGLGMTAVGFATWGVLSAGAASASAASASTLARTAATPTVAPTTPTVAPTVTPTVVPTAPVTTVPTAPPATGGGGTAGLQDAVLFGIGGAALLVGSGSIVYRIRGNKQR